LHASRLTLTQLPFFNLPLILTHHPLLLRPLLLLPRPQHNMLLLLTNSTCITGHFHFSMLPIPIKILSHISPHHHHTPQHNQVPNHFQYKFYKRPKPAANSTIPKPRTVLFKLNSKTVIMELYLKINLKVARLIHQTLDINIQRPHRRITNHPTKLKIPTQLHLQDSLVIYQIRHIHQDMRKLLIGFNLTFFTQITKPDTLLSIIIQLGYHRYLYMLNPIKRPMQHHLLQFSIFIIAVISRRTRVQQKTI
jgi:hypothetical protein